MDSQANSKLDYTGALNRLLTSTSTPKLGLEPIARILQHLENPQRRFHCIHVAGTNGKGSTCAFLSSALQTQYRTGLYTSPHLLCTRERIQIAGNLIDETLFCEAEEAVNEAARQTNEKPTFFERMTAMAFWAFAQTKVDVAVIEVGLGGRLDATNVIEPMVSVITHIALDHCHILGDSLEAIAKEKCGIIKDKTPVVTGWQEPPAFSTIESIAHERGAPMHNVTDPYMGKLSLHGKHQTHNAALALAGLKATGLKLDLGLVESAFSRTPWPCRMEKIDGKPVIIDGAHNPDGMRALVQSLAGETPLTLVIGTTKGHDSRGMIEELGALGDRIKEIILTQSRSPRAEDPINLCVPFSKLAPCSVERKVSDAVSRAIHQGRLTIVAGSLYVAGEARGLFYEMPTDPSLPHY